MISEEMLKKAAAEADQAIRDSLPAPEECVHEFSELFQKRMCRIFRRAKHPVLYRLLKQAACIVFAVIIAGSSWLAVDTEARAAFFAWVREHCEAFVEYRFIGDAPAESEIEEYELSWLPTGFSEISRLEADGNSVIVYQDLSDNIIQFSYSQGDDSISLFVQDEHSEIQNVQVGNVIAEFYRSNDPDSANVLTWASEDGDMMFCITSTFSKDTMVKLAEGVQKKS